MLKMMQITAALVLGCSALLFVNASTAPSAGDAIKHGTETMMLFINTSQCENYYKSLLTNFFFIFSTQLSVLPALVWAAVR